MILKIRTAYYLVTSIQAQLKCALEACKKDQFKEARQYLEMSQKDTEQLRKELKG
jgi:hypothetical protein